MAVGTRPEFDYPLAARVAPPTFAPLWMALSSKLSRPPPGHQGPLRGSYPSKTPARIKVAFGSTAAGRVWAAWVRYRRNLAVGARTREGRLSTPEAVIGRDPARLTVKITINPISTAGDYNPLLQTCM